MCGVWVSGVCGRLGVDVAACACGGVGCAFVSAGVRVWVWACVRVWACGCVVCGCGNYHEIYNCNYNYIKN